MNNITTSFDEVISAIKNTLEYQEYLSVKKKMREHDKINSLIKEIKFLQKEIVKMEYSGVDITKKNEEYNAKLAELSAYPLYNSFIVKQQKVNEILQLTKEKIEQFLLDITI